MTSLADLTEVKTIKADAFHEKAIDNYISFLKFTNSWLPVMTSNVVPLDAIGVEVVQDSNADFIAITVIRLGLGNRFFAATGKNWIILISRFEKSSSRIHSG